MKTFNDELENFLVELVRENRIGAKESSQLRKTLENTAAVSFFGGPWLMLFGSVVFAGSVGVPVVLGSTALFLYVATRGVVSDSGHLGRVYKLRRSDFEKRKAIFDRLERLLADRLNTSDKIQLLHVLDSTLRRKSRSESQGINADQRIIDQIVISQEELDALTAAFPKNADAIREFIAKIDSGAIQPEEEAFDVDAAADQLFEGAVEKEIPWFKDKQELTIIDTKGLFEDLIDRTLHNIYVKQDLYALWMQSTGQKNPISTCSDDVYGEFIKREESQEARFFEQRLKEYFGV